jgi:hypothetical protein
LSSLPPSKALVLRRSHNGQNEAQAASACAVVDDVLAGALPIAARLAGHGKVKRCWLLRQWLCWNLADVHCRIATAATGTSATLVGGNWFIHYYLSSGKKRTLPMAATHLSRVWLA